MLFILDLKFFLMQRLTKTRLAKSFSYTFYQFDIDCRFQIFSGVLKKEKKKKKSRFRRIGAKPQYWNTVLILHLAA